MKKIKLTQGKYALVDDDDYKWLNQWKWAHHNGYAIRNKWNNKIRSYDSIKMHRLILNTPQNLLTDHINRNGLDNRRCNLRLATHSQNNMNKEKLKNKSSKYKGVHKNKKLNKWQVSIRFKNKLKHIGLFDNEWHAAMAYNLWAKDLYGEYTRLNFKKVSF